MSTLSDRAIKPAIDSHHARVVFKQIRPPAPYLRAVSAINSIAKIFAMLVKVSVSSVG